MKRILFLHQNFPGQFRHLAPAFSRMPGHEVLCLGERQNMTRQVQAEGLRLAGYEHPDVAGKPHHYLRKTEAAIRRGQTVARALLQLKKKGYSPDLIVAHPGWGEALFVKDVFPQAKLLAYCEFYYRNSGSNFNFDPEYPGGFDAALRVRVEAASYLLTLEAMDLGLAPTRWQHSVHPAGFRERIAVIHDGIDTAVAQPDPAAVFTHEKLGLRFAHGDELVTYVSRNLEPARGFHVFMRALPHLLAARPRAHVAIVGGDGVSYSGRSRNFPNYRSQMLAELGDSIDLSRVHFLGRLPYQHYLRLLQVSAVHVYLTTPFVLSWSLMESLACGCLVVGSDTAPVREVIRHGHNGYLADFFNPAALAGQVADLLATLPDRREVRAEARRGIVERYDLRKVCLPEQIRLLRSLAG